MRCGRAARAQEEPRRRALEEENARIVVDLQQLHMRNNQLSTEVAVLRQEKANLGKQSVRCARRGSLTRL